MSKILALTAVVLLHACPVAAADGLFADAREFAAEHYRLSVRLPEEWDVDEGEVISPTLERVFEARKGQASITVVTQDLLRTLREAGETKWRTRVAVDVAFAGAEAGLAANSLDGDPNAGDLGPAVPVSSEGTRLASLPAGHAWTTTTGATGETVRHDVYVVVHNGQAFYAATEIPEPDTAAASTVRFVLDSLEISRQYGPAVTTPLRRAVPLIAASGAIVVLCAAAWLASVTAVKRKRRSRGTAPSSPSEAPTAPLVLLEGRSPDLASGGQRLATLLIDYMAVVIISVVLLLVFEGVLSLAASIAGVAGPGEEVTSTINSLAGLIFFVVYYGCAEGLTGRTIGKLAAGTRVVMADGSQPRFSVTFRRALCRLIPLDAFSFLGHEGRTGWHDRFSGTLVITLRKRPAKGEAAPGPGVPTP
jgi:uncharacterized RDD family membrane protein YckC